MFIFLSKLLPLFIYPLGLTWILLLLCLLMGSKNKSRNVILVAAFILLWIASTRWVSYSLARSLEWQNKPLIEIPVVDAIVVLGGGTEPMDYPRPTVETNGAGDRVFYAVKLFHQGKAPHILLSGGNIPEELDPAGTTGSTPASQMAEIIAEMDVPGEAVWLEEHSRNTYENALYTGEFLRGKNLNRIILVTSAAHMPRAAALFRFQGMEVIPAPTDYVVTEAGWNALTNLNPASQIFWILPNVSNLSLTTSMIKEYIGMFVYRLRGWM